MTTSDCWISDWNFKVLFLELTCSGKPSNSQHEDGTFTLLLLLDNIPLVTFVIG